MEITESFKIESETEVSRYLEQRGFKLFKQLNHELNRQREHNQQQFYDDNWEGNEHFRIHDDYVQYDFYSNLKKPSTDQLHKTEEQFQLLCFPELQRQKDNILKVEFGSKIGQSTYDKTRQWIEKWATFTLFPSVSSSNNHSYKYFCKFWNETITEINSEVKFQYFNDSDQLIKEDVEKCKVIIPENKIIDLMSYTSYFEEGSEKYQEGFAHRFIDADNYILEKWRTDFRMNTNEKENNYRSRVSLDKKGERSGQNQYGQLWGEEWYQSTDGSQGWKKWTEEEHDTIKQKWGESEHIIGDNKVTRSKWQEKWKKECDYWEQFYEEETCDIRNYETKPLEYQIKSGLKEFKNNRNYYLKEEWKEQLNGKVTVERINDDGHGKKITESYSAIKRGGQLYSESSNEVVDDIANNIMIKIDKGKLFNEYGQEWENQIIHNFRENYDTIVKRGKDHIGVWTEAWYEKNNEKWAKKEGQNYLTADLWKEEWYERRGDNGVDMKCEKWGANYQRNEEWMEKWGETFNGNKKEKWADKWYVDKNTGFRRGENWGHEYDDNMQPKHHWCEHWDTEGQIVKRNEYY